MPITHTSRRGDVHTTHPFDIRRNVPLVLALLAGLHLLLAALVFEPAPHTGGDNGVYVTLAQSLLLEGGYRSMHEPGAPLHTQYPPGFPVLLAVALAAGLAPWVQLKFVVLAMSVLAVAASFLWLVRRRRPGLAFGVALLLAVSPAVLEQSHWVLSDTPFWAFTMLALWGFERLPRGRRWRFGFAVAMTFAAYFTRSAGLPLVVAALAFLAMRRRWRQFAVLAAVIGVPALFWWLRARTGGGVDYVSQFWYVNPYLPEAGSIGPSDLVQRILENIRRYQSWHLPTLLAGRMTPVPFVFGLGVTLLAFWGWARRLGRPGVAEIFLPLYLALIMVWPQVWSGERFLLPALPLMLYYAGDALARMVRRVHAPASTGAGAVVTAAVVIVALPTLVEHAGRGLSCSAAYRAGDRYACLPPEWTDFYATADWAGARLPSDAVVLSRKPGLFYVESGLAGGYYPMARHPAELIRHADSLGARYVVLDGIDNLAQSYLAPVLLRRPAAFCVVTTASASATTLFGIRADAASLPDKSPDTGMNTDTQQFAACDDSYLRAGAGSL